MGKTFIVAEKPSVAGDIAKALGGFKRAGAGDQTWYERDDALVSCGIGHLVGIKFPQEFDKGWTLPALPVIAEEFDLVPIAKTEGQLKLLGKLLRRADVTEVVNACDAGREGELIFRYIAAYHDCRKPMSRMWMQSMTPDAIRAAFQGRKAADAFKGLFFAAICRSEADLLVGANATRGLTGYQRHVFGEGELQNAGRVQTPTLALTVDRENAIRTFVPRDYWEVQGTFQCAGGEYRGKWFRPDFKKEFENDPDAAADRLLVQAEADAIVQRCKGVGPDSVTEETKPTSAPPPRLFDLTTLQQEANSKFRFSAKKTLDLAQALYEKHKVLTYPRTDADALPEDYVDTARQVLESLGGAVAQHARQAVDQGWVKADKRIFNNAKISDHFAIIPTLTAPGELSVDERKIYDLVSKRFVAAFFPAAVSNKTVRITAIGADHFKSTGSVLVDAGWTAVYGREARKGDEALTPYVPGEKVQTTSVESKGLKTKAPDRYTDATLLSAMESAGKLVEDSELQDAMKGKGLGTPATRAATIEGLLSQVDGNGKAKPPYLVRDEQYLVPTEKAMRFIAFARESGMGTITSAQLTGEWEHKLALIEKGQFTRKQFMADIRALSSEIIDIIKRKVSITPAAPVPEAKVLDVPCPKCGGEVEVRRYAYECKAGCGLKLPLELLGSPIREAEARAILRGETPTLKGMRSKGKAFDAGIRYQAPFEKLEFVFAERGEQTGSGESLGDCPKCGSPVVQAGEHFRCEKGVGAARECDFIVWGEMSKKRLTAKVVQELLANKRTEVLSGFKSSQGKPFSAALKIEGGKVAFDFPARS